MEEFVETGEETGDVFGVNVVEGLTQAATVNTSTTLWKYVQVYGDIGLVKNKFQDAKFVYDSGIRLNLVTDYFEIYFPIYSNLGWEIGNPDYDQHIRFIFTIDPEVLLGLFRRKWY